MTRNQTFHDLTMDTRAVPKKSAKGATLLGPRNTKIAERKKGLTPLQAGNSQ